MERMKIILPNGKSFTVLASQINFDCGVILLEDDEGCISCVVPIGSCIIRVGNKLGETVKNDWL